MKNFFYSTLTGLCSLIYAATGDHLQDGWVSLFDGKTLNNWKVGENAGTFTIENGMIVAHGPVAHLFYLGDV